MDKVLAQLPFRRKYFYAAVVPQLTGGDGVDGDPWGDLRLPYRRPRAWEKAGSYSRGAIGMNFLVDDLRPSDWEQVRSIYLEGIASGNATFETQAPTWEKWDAAHLPFARLVARGAEVVLGWSALSPVSDRCCYAGVAEASLYVGARHRSQGVGAALLQVTIEQAERNGVWTLQAGIFPENLPSLALVRKFGFREVGRRERLGKMHGVWRDVIMFERRSSVVGV
jgi:phosphinothricin acetyltransferase